MRLCRNLVKCPVVFMTITGLYKNARIVHFLSWFITKMWLLSIYKMPQVDYSLMSFRCWLYSGSRIKSTSLFSTKKPFLNWTNPLIRKADAAIRLRVILWHRNILSVTSKWIFVVIICCVFCLSTASWLYYFLPFRKWTVSGTSWEHKSSTTRQLANREQKQ